MPVGKPKGEGKPKPRRSEKLARPASETGTAAPPPGGKVGVPRTWEDLEATKMRAMDALSRVEYLASSQSRFYDFRRGEHKDMEFACRSARTLPGHGNDADMSKLRAAKIMGKSPSSAAELLAAQKAFLQSSPKSKKRMDMIDRFVADSEMKRSGAIGAEAAKNSAKGNQPPEVQLPDYHSVIRAPNYLSGHQPMQSVSLMPYAPPESALRHGMSTSRSLPSLSASAGASTR